MGFSRESWVGHHCSLSPGERTLWRLTPFGSARLGSPTHSRSRFALTHLLLPCHPTAPPRPPRVAPFYINPRFVPASSPLPAGKWEWTLVQRWIDPLCNLRLTPRSPSRFHGRSFLPFHPRRSTIPVAATTDDGDDFSARRRTLIPISKIRLPSKPRIDWQRQRQRAPPKATPAALASLSRPPTILEVSRKARKIRFFEFRIQHNTSFSLARNAFSRRKVFLLLNYKNCISYKEAMTKLKTKNRESFELVLSIYMMNEQQLSLCTIITLSPTRES